MGLVLPCSALHVPPPARSDQGQGQRRGVPGDDVGLPVAGATHLPLHAEVLCLVGAIGDDHGDDHGDDQMEMTMETSLFVSGEPAKRG